MRLVFAILFMMLLSGACAFCFTTALRFLIRDDPTRAGIWTVLTILVASIAFIPSMAHPILLGFAALGGSTGVIMAMSVTKGALGE